MPPCTTVLLIRHAVHAVIDRVLVGRAARRGLNSAGFAQAEDLARRLAGLPISRVQSSPQLRARQTAQPLATARQLSIEIAPAADEIDFGAWSGRAFADLDTDPWWRRWNRERGSVTAPGGESMRQVQRRLVDHLGALHAAHPGACVAVVSHAEPIRAAVMHARGIPLDDFHCVRIDPASVTTLRVDDQRWTIVGENAADLVAA